MKEAGLKDIKSKLTKSGYPTELKVAKHFHDKNWHVKYSNYYIDKDENKGREIDLICEYFVQNSSEDNSHLEMLYKFIIEVKKSQNNPWIIFTTKRKTDELIHGLPKNYISTKNNDRKALREIFNNNNHGLKEELGRNYSVGVKNQVKDQIFQALCSVTKAFEEAYLSDIAHRDESGDMLVSYIEPLIVIEGELISAFINDKFELEVNNENYIQMRFNYLSPNYNNRVLNRLIVHIIRDTFLDEYIDMRTKQFNKISDLILEHYRFTKYENH